MKTRPGTAVARLVSSCLLLVGCDDDGPTGSPEINGELPSPEVTAFTGGEFDNIQLPRGATEISEKTVRDGAIAQSFTVTATSPEQIMEFFSVSLPEDGWNVIEAPASSGIDSIHGAWARDGRRLEVSTTLAQGVENERTQFSIVLLPSLASAGEIPGG